LYSDEIVILEELGLDNMPDLFTDYCGIYKLTDAENYQTV
jgi:hypothetical protein